MKTKVITLSILAVFGIVAFTACGGKKAVPVTTETPPTTTDQTTTEPDKRTEPEIKKINESEFAIVYFDYDRSEVRDDQVSALEQNATILKENLGLTVQIEGHCDERGTIEYNMALGDSRANTVKSYLVNLGVASERLQTISYGKERPAMMGHDDGAWSKNRRAQFRIVSQ